GFSKEGRLRLGAFALSMRWASLLQAQTAALGAGNRGPHEQRTTAMNPLILLAQETAPDAGAGLFGGAMAVMCALWAVGIAATVFWLWMLIDALVNEPTTN